MPRAPSGRRREQTYPGRRGSGGGCSASPRRVLDLTDAESQHDISDTANDGEGRYPSDEENGAAPVVTRRPEAERELDDAADQLEPPHLDLVPRGDRDDDVDRPADDEEEAEHRSERAEGVARVDERNDPGSD